MRYISTVVTMILITFLMTCISHSKERNMNIPDKPENIQPIAVGERIPPISLRSINNALIDLNSAIAAKPTVLIFYRGGWCPYCNLQLSQLQKIEPELIKLGFQIIAVSPDLPEKLKASIDKHHLSYRLLSDSEMTAAQALGIAFHLDDATVTKYKNEYKIDVEADSGHTHHLLPVPAVFIVGKDGLIYFSYVNPDYKVRLEGGVLLDAARELLKKSGTKK